MFKIVHNLLAFHKIAMVRVRRVETVMEFVTQSSIILDINNEL